MNMTSLLSAIALVTAAAAQERGPLTLANEFLEVSYDPAAATFTLKPTDGTALPAQRGRFGQPRSPAVVAPVDDPIFGAGKQLVITGPDGRVDRLSVFPRLPFALFGATLANRGAQAVVLNRVDMLSLTADLGVPTDAVRSLGTAGLELPAKQPGSYVYLALADPATRRGLVGAWLTHDRGSGVVFSPVADDKVALEAKLDYGRLRIKPGESAESERFALGLFADARLGLEAWADAVARVYKIKLRPQPSGYCTWYSDQHGGAGSEQSLAELAAFCAKELKPFGFEVLQIDDGWQLGASKNGPHKWFIGHRPTGSYPSGMAATATTIRKAGLTPGIWFMPFAGNYNDPAFEAHQDWFVRRADGKPYETAWGGTSLDMTVPGAREHLAQVAKACRDWGYTYFKMDGLYTGIGCNQVYVNDGWVDDKLGDAVFANPDVTNVEAFRSGFKLIRQTAGDDVFFLGCCVSQNMRSFGASIGLVDAMRIGPDNGTQWHSVLTSHGTGRGLLAGPAAGSRRYFFHNRIWYNDPDPVYVRNSLKLNHARLISAWAGVTGNLTINSDWLPTCAPERLDILKRIMPAHGRQARPVDLFDHDLPRVWTVGDASRLIVGVFNWEPQPKVYSETVARLGLPAGEYAAYDFWGKQLLPLWRDKLEVGVPTESCRVLAVRPLVGWPQVLSTSRHVTQGLLDLTEERFDAATGTLSGTSQVVAGDPYELRVLLVGIGHQLWALRGAKVDEGDVTVTSAAGAGLARVTLTSATSRPVHWSLTFGPGDAASLAPTAATQVKAEALPFAPVKLTWMGTEGAAYEVARDGGPAQATSGASFSDATARPGQRYVYQVTALNLLGERSAPVSVTVNTPELPKLGPVPPLPAVSVMGLKPVKLQNGHGAAQVGKSCDGGTLTLGGDKFTDGLGLHAPARVVYKREVTWGRFVAVCGLDEEVRKQEGGSVDFAVLSDNGGEEPVVLAKSPVLTWGQVERWHFDVALPADCKQVILVTGDGGDGIRCDHADWCNAGFLLKLPAKQDTAYDVAPKLAQFTPKTSKFGEFTSLDFKYEGRNAKVVQPKVALEGHPWAWRTEFFGHEPQTDLALLTLGFHVVTIDVMGMMGAPPAMAIFDKFYDLLQTVGLSKKASFIGMSRGGLYAYNWAIHRPDTVTALYGDAPVLDFKSWPGKRNGSKSSGSPGDWAAVIKYYGFKDAAEADAYKGNPVDQLEVLAKAKIPIINVVGDADRVVPVDENSNLVEERYPKLGGVIKVIHKPGVDHHPHSLKDPTPMVEFIVKATFGG